MYSFRLNAGTLIFKHFHEMPPTGKEIHAEHRGLYDRAVSCRAYYEKNKRVAKITPLKYEGTRGKWIQNRCLHPLLCLCVLQNTVKKPFWGNPYQ